MLTQEKYILLSDLNTTSKAISVHIKTVVKDGDKEVANNLETRAFAPGEIEDVKSFTGVDYSPEIDYLNAIWTPDVIAAYQALQQNGLP